MSTAIIQVDLAAELPAYEQIVDSLRALLVSGAFKPGSQLPTVRQMAMDLGLHHNTVAQAYRLLAQEGWLDLRRGRGAVVLQRSRPNPAPETQPQFARRLSELVAKGLAAGLQPREIAEYMESLATCLRAGGET